MLHVGNHRFVLVIGAFVIKVPKIRFKRALSDLLWVIRDFLFYKPCMSPLEAHQDGVCHHTKKSLLACNLSFLFEALTGGFRENVREAACYFRTKHRLLPRVYLPLILFNVSARKQGVGNFTYFDGDELYGRIYRQGDDDYTKSLGHTFDTKDNFAFDGRQVWMIDSGASRVMRLLEKYGDKVEATLLTEAGPPPRTTRGWTSFFRRSSVESSSPNERPPLLQTRLNDRLELSAIFKRA